MVVATVVATFRQFTPSRPSHTIAAFILFTLIQIIIFLFCPQVYNNAAPGMDTPPTYALFRLIGIKECGLVFIYVAIAITEDHLLMKMTIVGRMTVIPFTLWCVYGLGAPTTMLFGVLQDVIFGGWTAWSLFRNGNQHRKDRKDRKDKEKDGRDSKRRMQMFGMMARMVILTMSGPGVYIGWLNLTSPEVMLTTQ